jgi:hypothetical protein
MRVGLMIPCYIDMFYPRSGSADIGGVTVHPAQGATTLTEAFVPRPPNQRPGASQPEDRGRSA